MMQDSKNLYIIRAFAALLVLVNSIWLLGGGTLFNAPLINPFISACGEIGIAALFIGAGYEIRLSLYEKKKIIYTAMLLPILCLIASVLYKHIMFVKWQLNVNCSLWMLILIIIISIVSGLYLHYMECGDSKEDDNAKPKRRNYAIAVIIGIMILYLSTFRLYDAAKFDSYGIVRRVYYLFAVLLITIIMYYLNRIKIGNNVVKKVLVRFSEISYAVVIVHWILIRLLLSHEKALQGLFQRGFVRYPLLLLLSLLIGYISHKLWQLFLQGDYMRRIIIAVLVIMVIAISLICWINNKKKFHTDHLEEAGYKIENVHVTVEGIERPYHFLWVSDLHIAIAGKEVKEEELTNVKTRESNQFVTDTGIKSSDLWTGELAKLLDESNADGILFGGDMADFCSEANLSCFKQGLKDMKTPYLYARADHDSFISWLTPDAQDKCKNLQDMICNNTDVMYLEHDKFIILTFNNSTSQLTEVGRNVVKSVFEKNKPIIIMTHVPFESKIDESLSKLSKESWQDRDLTWGRNTSYQPDSNTSVLLEYVYKDNSLVKEVLGGHLHFSWDGQLTESVHQHVFGPAFKGYVGVITIDKN